VTNLHRPLLAALAVMICVLSFAPVASAARRKVPSGWMGTAADARLISQTSDLRNEGRHMTRNGVESVRAVFDWSHIQQYEKISQVPAAERSRFAVVDGIPTDFTDTDALVRRAALQRLSLLPIVTHTPRWAAQHPSAGVASPPDRPFEYGRFVHALVARYGPHGSFWPANPDVPRRPLRHWQIYNEPHIGQQWSVQPYERSYVEVLRQARIGARSADGGAKIVLAGLANFSWIELGNLYREGARGSFDIAAAHIYTRKPGNLTKVLDRFRRVMRRNGDRRKEVWLTEFGWASRRGGSGGQVVWEVPDRTAAKYTSEAYSRLSRARRKFRLGRTYWYTWLTQDSGRNMWEKRTGLRRVLGPGRVRNKRVLTSFRRAAVKLEGCRKRWSSTRCR